MKVARPVPKGRGRSNAPPLPDRSLRGAVIYRKLSLGSQSEDGETRTARLLTAHTTCRLQDRSLFDYLTDTLTHHARGEPVPLLA